MNKLLSLLLVLLFTQSCSFKPMLADKSYNFKFVNIKFEGDRNINQILNQELKDISKGKKEYDIYFKTKKNKEIVSSNAKGDPEKFRLEISLDYNLIFNGDTLVKNSVSKESTYNNINDKFELSQFEKNIIKNLTKELFQTMLMSVTAIDS